MFFSVAHTTHLWSVNRLGVNLERTRLGRVGGTHARKRTQQTLRSHLQRSRSRREALWELSLVGRGRIRPSPPRARTMCRRRRVEARRTTQQTTTREEVDEETTAKGNVRGVRVRATKGEEDEEEDGEEDEEGAGAPQTDEEEEEVGAISTTTTTTTRETQMRLLTSRRSPSSQRRRASS